MARKRWLSDEIWSDPDLGVLSSDIRELYLSCWGFADDNGVLSDDPRPHRLRVFGFRDDGPSCEQVAEWWALLKARGFLVPFMADGQPWVAIKPHGWERHQLPIKNPSIRNPKPDFLRGRRVLHEKNGRAVAIHVVSWSCAQCDRERSSSTPGLVMDASSPARAGQGQGQGPSGSPDPVTTPRRDPTPHPVGAIERVWATYLRLIPEGQARPKGLMIRPAHEHMIKRALEAYDVDEVVRSVELAAKHCAAGHQTWNWADFRIEVLMKVDQRDSIARALNYRPTVDQSKGTATPTFYRDLTKT